MRIGLYGGAFNPIHIGHLKVMTHALAVGNLDELRVLPAWKHSFAKDMAPFDDRIQMIQLAFARLSDPKIKVSNAEQVWQIKYTVDLVERLRQQEPDNTWVLIIGEDNLATADRWHRWDDLTKLAELFVVPDQGTTRSTLIRGAIQAGHDQVAQGMIPEEVLRYIKGRKLYLTP